MYFEWDQNNFLPFGLLELRRETLKGNYLNYIVSFCRHFNCQHVSNAFFILSRSRHQNYLSFSDFTVTVKKGVVQKILRQSKAFMLQFQTTKVRHHTAHCAWRITNDHILVVSCLSYSLSICWRTESSQYFDTMTA